MGSPWLANVRVSDFGPRERSRGCHRTPRPSAPARSRSRLQPWQELSPGRHRRYKAVLSTVFDRPLQLAISSPGARRSPLPPGFIVPCLPTPAKQCKSGPAWVHEIKHDGYRLIVRRTSDRVRVEGRERLWSNRPVAICLWTSLVTDPRRFDILPRLSWRTARSHFR